MPKAAPAGLSPRERLRTPAEFRRVFRLGTRVDGRLFLLVAATNDRGFARLGLAASRRVGGAVQRNRAKRLLREVFRRHKPDAWDLIFVAKAELAACGLLEVESEYQQRLKLLLRRRAARRPGAAAPPAR